MTDERATRMPERTLEGHVVNAARKLGWLAYHTYDSRRSAPGFPDLVLVHPRTYNAVIFAELKTEKGRVSPEQQIWLDSLADAGARTYVWRPRDWFSGEITRVLEVRDGSNEE